MLNDFFVFLILSFIFLQMYDEGENIVNININSNDDMANEDGRYLSIQNYNGIQGLPNWGYVEPENNKTNSG